MKTRLFFSVLGLLFSVLGAPAQTLYKNVQKTTDGNNGLVENLTVPTGRTLARTGTGVITLSDTLANLSVTNGAALDSWAAITRASGFDTFVATPSSANLASLVTGETGSGALVFATSPTLVTPNIGAATGTSLTLSSLTSGRVPYATTAGLLTDSANLTFNGSTLTLAGGVASTSTSTGTVVISGSGGLGVGGAGYIGGVLNVAGNATFTSGSFVMSGGAGSNVLTFDNSTSTTRLTTSFGGSSLAIRVNAAGSDQFTLTGSALTLGTATPLIINSTTASTSTTTGALTVAGGLGVAGVGYFGGGPYTSGSSLTLSLVNYTGADSSTAQIFAVQKGGTTKFRVQTDEAVLALSPTGGLGYGTGAGGTVTQITSRTTGVTINKVTGAITLVSAAGSTSWQSFTVTNSAVAATDTIILNQVSGTDLYLLHVTAVGAGSFRITFATTGGTTTEQPVIRFTVIKSVSS